MAKVRGRSVPYLKAWREWRALSQSELAAAAHVTRGTVARAEGGQVVSYGNIRELARALDIAPDQLQHAAPVEEMPTMPLAVVPPAAPENPEAEAHAAFWEAKRREALTYDEPARTAMLEMYSMKQYGRPDADLARRIHAEHVVDADTTTDATPALKHEQAEGVR